MPEPKPPPGWDAWLDYILDRSLDMQAVQYARAEYAKLWEEARKYREGTTLPLRDRAMIPMMFIREDRLSDIKADANKWREANRKLEKDMAKNREECRRLNERREDTDNA